MDEDVDCLWSGCPPFEGEACPHCGRGRLHGVVNYPWAPKYPYEAFDMTGTALEDPYKDMSPEEVLAELGRLAQEVKDAPKPTHVVARRCVCSEEERSLSSVTMYPEGAVPWWFCETCNGAYAPNHETLEVADG